MVIEETFGYWLVTQRKSILFGIWESENILPTLMVVGVRRP